MISRLPQAHRRFWALVCAWLLLPWMQLAMAGSARLPVSCCQSMPGMSQTAVQMHVEHVVARLHGSGAAAQVSCLARCSIAGTASSAIAGEALAPAQPAAFGRIVFVVPVADAAGAYPWAQAAPPRFRPPPFLAARLQV